MIRLSFILLAIMLFIVGCATVPMQIDYDHGYSFRGIQYYTWLDNPPSQQNLLERNTAVAQQIVRKVNAQLQARGFQEVPVDSADFLLAFHIGSKDRLLVSETGYYYLEWGSRFHDYRYHQGTLVIDIIDPQSRRLVWRGWSTGVVDLDPESLQNEVDRAIEKLMANFPPQ